MRSRSEYSYRFKEHLRNIEKQEDEKSPVAERLLNTTKS